MPGYTDEQHKRFYEKTGRWHYGAPDHLKKPKPYDPSAAEADSLAVSKERAVSGVATAPDSLRLRMAGVPGFKVAEDKPYDPSVAIQDSIAARLLRGDTTGAAKLRVPPEASYSVREAADQDGNPTFVRVNSRTGEMAPINTGLRPKTGGTGDDDKAEGEYTKAMDKANTIAGKISRIRSILNTPGDTYADDIGGTKYVDRPALTKELEGLQKEQRYYLIRTAKSELTTAMPPAQFKGQRKRDKLSGQIFESDGKQWNPVSK